MYTQMGRLMDYLKLFLIVLLLLGAADYTAVALAQQPPVGIPGNVELDGYAWSSNIGWISLNCKTGGVAGNDICVSSNYGLTLSSATGLLTGYAWSSNIGWIKFGGLAAFPTGGGTVAQNVRVTGTYPTLNFEGWARACAGTVPGDCSVMTSRTDGWDGWISLRGTGPDYGISTNAAAFTTSATSFAWGSDVVGWLTFGPATLLFPPVSLTGTTCEIAVGSSTCNGVVSWNISSASNPNLYNVTTNATYAMSLTGTDVPVSLAYGLNTIAARDSTAILRTVPLTTTCAIPADFTNGTTCELAVVPAPVITLKANQKIVRSKSTVGISWTITPSPLASGTCTIYGPGMPGNVTGSGSKASSPLSAKTKFVMSCSGPYGTVEASEIVDVIPGVQEV